MATKYWRVGGTNTWSSTANWSDVSPTGATGAAIPVIGDDVVISNVGQTAGTINITATATAKLNSWTVIGGTWTVAGSQQVNIAGTFDCQNVTWTNTGTLSLQGTGGSYDITASGTTFNCAVQFNGFIVAGSSFNLLSAFTTGATQTTTLTAGTLILNNFTLTTGIFNTNATNTRQIQFGTGNIALIHTTAATTVLVLSNYTNFSCSGTGGFTSAMSVTRTFNVGSTGATNSITANLALTSGSSVPSFTAGGWFNHLNFTGSSVTVATLTVNINSLTLASGSTYTALTVNAVGTGTITSAGKSLTAFTVNHTGTTTLSAALSTGVTATTTLTQGTLDLGGFTLTTGAFSSSNSNTRAIAFGTGNIALSHTTAATTVLNMATATGFTWTGTGGFTVAAMSNTRTFSFGSTAGGTTTNAPNLTFTSGASIATITTAGWFNKLDYGTTSFTQGTTALNLNGLTLSSSGTYTSLSPTMRGTGTITSNGKTIAAFTVNHAGTTTLASALSCTTYTQTAGTINRAGFNLSCSSTATYTAGTIAGNGTINCTTFTVSGTLTQTVGGISASTSFVITSGSFTYDGGTLFAVPTFTHTAGTVTFNISYALTTTGTYTHTAGTINLADGVTLSTGIFSSNNTNTRSIAFGTGNINLTHTSAATTVLSMATATGFTYTGTGGFTVAAMSATKTFVFGTTGGTTSIAPNLTFTTGASVATLTTGSWFNTLDFGTTSFILGTTSLNLNGLTLSTSGTSTSYNLLTVTMRGTGTMNKGAGVGRAIAAMTINHTGTTTLVTGLQINGALTLTEGTLDGGLGYGIQCNTFASTGTATRSITGPDGSVINVMGSGATAFSNDSAAGITIVGYTINMNSDSAKTFAGGGGSYAALTQSYTDFYAVGPGVLTISGNNSFTNLKYNQDLGSIRTCTITFTISTTQTVTDFTLSGAAGNVITINSSTPGTQATLSKSSGTVSVDYLSIKDSNATGGATWYAGANSVDAGNNTGWIFTAPPSPSTAGGKFFLFF